MTQEEKDFIDNSDYETLLRRWRHDVTWDTIFQGESGEYYAEALFKKRQEIGEDAAVNISKRVGW